ncbi:hypothetical protein Tco_0786887 [Tanacetum coccineum]
MVIPGRRLYGSSNWTCCRWIGWVDPPMCPRSIQIIPGLLRARNRHEASIQELTNEVAKLKNLPSPYFHMSCPLDIHSIDYMVYHGEKMGINREVLVTTGKGKGEGAVEGAGASDGLFLVPHQMASLLVQLRV